MVTHGPIRSRISQKSVLRAPFMAHLQLDWNVQPSGRVREPAPSRRQASCGCEVRFALDGSSIPRIRRDSKESFLLRWAPGTRIWYNGGVDAESRRISGIGTGNGTRRWAPPGGTFRNSAYWHFCPDVPQDHGPGAGRAALGASERWQAGCSRAFVRQPADRQARGLMGMRPIVGALSVGRASPRALDEGRRAGSLPGLERGHDLRRTEMAKKPRKRGFGDKKSVTETGPSGTNFTQ